MGKENKDVKDMIDFGEGSQGTGIIENDNKVIEDGKESDDTEITGSPHLLKIL